MDADFPIIEATAIKAPKSITSKEVRAHFETLAKNLLSVQSLTEQDLAALEQAHLSLERASALMKELIRLEKGGCIGDKDIYCPVLRAYRGAMDTYASIVYRFGVSPVERTKITRKLAIDNGKGSLANLIGRAK